MASKRIEYFDTAKGICILLVVMTHVFDDTYGLDYPAKMQLETIRMPLYFILSGLFFKTYTGFVDFAVHKVNKILIPFLCFQTLFVVLEKLMANVGDGIFSGWHAPLWFLLCLFEMNIIFCALRLLIKNDILLMALCCALGVAFSYAGYIFGYLASAFSCLPFFVFGYFLRNKTNFLTDGPSWWKSLVLVGGTVVASTLLAGVCYYAWNKFDMNIFALYFCGCLGTLAIISVTKFFGAVPLLSYVGRYSLIVLIFHFGVMKLANAALSVAFDLNPYVAASILLVVTVAITTLLIAPIKRYLAYVTAQKDLFDPLYWSNRLKIW